jgi:hypothetical protein
LRGDNHVTGMERRRVWHRHQPVVNFVCIRVNLPDDVPTHRRRHPHRLSPGDHLQPVAFHRGAKVVDLVPPGDEHAADLTLQHRL